jgi:hypothetical protein
MRLEEDMLRLARELTSAVGRDERFYFGNRGFHVGRLWALMKKDRSIYKSEVITTSELKQLSGYFRLIRIDEKYAEKFTDKQLKEPGIWIDDGRFSLLVDGWHRAYANWKRGNSWKVYVVTDLDAIAEVRL